MVGRFHPSAPDDLQAIVHDGGPRMSDRAPELVWVTVTKALGENLFRGRVLNRPHQLKNVGEGTMIHFIAPQGEHLLMVTEKYLAERPDWNITACTNCGLDELFDAPSDLIPVIFPNMPANASMSVFTSFCGMCGGVQVVQSNIERNDFREHEKPSPRKWWQFWRS